MLKITYILPKEQIKNLGNNAQGCFIEIILFEIHIILAFDHTVIKLSAFVCASAEAPFKFLIGRNNAIAPAVTSFKPFAHNGIKLFSSLNVEHTFAVRWIGD